MKTKILLLVSTIFLLLSSCNDVLDRPQLTSENDDTYWVNEQNIRLYANEYYAQYFVGYGTLWGVVYTPVTGYITSDDIVVNGTQRDIEVTIPNSRGNANTTAATLEWLESYNGPNWNFAWIRKSNLMLDRIEKRMGGILNDEQKNHWTGIGRFFRAMEYANLARVFGDVPYYNRIVEDFERDELYKPRTPRNEVMDEVYTDLDFALNNVRIDDGDQSVNRYVVAAFISRLMLYEGTTQKYHYNNNERAKKFLELAVKAADYVITSGKYDIVTDFRSLFGSEDLKGNKDCILYRHYDAAVKTTHSIATYCNMNESVSPNANLDLVKAFICNDGQPWQNSSLPNTDKFDLDNLIKTRDPRFEASFWHKPTAKATASALYTCKFIDREAPSIAAAGESLPVKYTSTNNVNDYPVMRYAEVLLNWIEAKAELATMGGPAVTPSDIETSINKIRLRPLDNEAKAKGVVQTKPLDLSNLPNDPKRDADVSALIWEIRRERRMELFFEHSRLIDLRRWKKMNYMDDSQNPDLLRGIWVNVPVDLPGELTAGNVNKLAVINASGQKIVYNGSNASQLVGYYSPAAIAPRKKFIDVPGTNIYLAPVGTNQRVDYQDKGYNLAQTEGWSQIMP